MSKTTALECPGWKQNLKSSLRRFFLYSLLYFIKQTLHLDSMLESFEAQPGGY